MAMGKISYLKVGGTCNFEGTFKADGSWDTGTYRKGAANYTGTFTDGQNMTGRFTIEWINSEIKYDGMVKNNKLHGDGIMTFKKSKIRELVGTWEDDKMKTCSKVTLEDGSTATNYNPITGQLEGRGVVRVGASTYEGTWTETGRLNGHGTISNDNDQGSFSGEFKENVRNGMGTYSWPAG